MIEASEVGLLAIEQDTSCPLLGVRVEGDIVGRVARVEVTQAFRNPLSKPLEAVYRFPLSEGATLTRFRARIGDRELEGEVEERDRAFEKYDKALEQGHGGYLLDEERPNIFTVSVGNLPPGREAVLTISYVEVLETVDGAVRFRLPTSISPRYVPDGYDDGNEIPVDGQIHPTYADDVPYGLTFRLRVHGRDSIQSVESPSHPIRTYFDQNGLLAVEAATESVRMDSDFVLLVNRTDLDQPKGWVSLHGDEIFLHVDLPHPGGHDESQDREEPTEVIFVLDASGSMQGSSYRQAKRALQIMLKALPERVRFNVFRFGSTYESLWDTSRAATPQNVEEALSYLQRSSADLGGTEMLRPLQAIYRERPAEGAVRNMVLLTDGEIGNEDQVISLARTAPGQIRLFTVGIGYGPNDYLVRQVARASGAESVIIPPGERLEMPILRLFKYLWGQPYERIRLDLPEAEQVPRNQLAYPGRTTGIFARIPATSDTDLATVKVKAQRGGKKLYWDVPLERLPAEVSPLPQLWARETIREIEEGDSGGSRQRERRASAGRRRAIQISRKYGVLCRATSYLIIEKREDEKRLVDAIVLQKVPTLITRDWHGSAVAELTLPSVAAMRVVRPASEPMEELEEVAEPELLQAEDGLDLILPKSRQAPTRLDETLLTALLDAQQPEGGFEPNEAVLSLLGLEWETLREIAKQLPVDDLKLALRLVFTALVLTILEQWFREEKQTWESLVAKSYLWLRMKLVDHPATVNGKPLDEWARKFVSTLKRPGSRPRSLRNRG